MIRLETETVERLLHENQEFADYFLSHLLTRTARVEADLVDQLFNSSKMRLARALLLLANYGNDRGLEPVAVKVDHDTLAALIGTTRSRVNVFSRVEDGRGSLGHSATPRFPSPLIKPDGPISGIRLSDQFHREAHDGGPMCTRLRCSTPSFPKTVSWENRCVPRPCTLCRLTRKCRTRS